LTAQISLLPYANEKVAAKVLEHAQDLKESDPKQSIELHEEVIRLLFEVLSLRALFTWTFTYGNSSLVNRSLVCRPVASLSRIPVFTNPTGQR
jgi:hypothetical protein